MHFGSNLLKEIELLNDEVVVVEEGLIDVLLNIVIKVWLNVERLI